MDVDNGRDNNTSSDTNESVIANTNEGDDSNNAITNEDIFGMNYLTEQKCYEASENATICAISKKKSLPSLKSIKYHQNVSTWKCFNTVTERFI